MVTGIPDISSIGVFCAAVEDLCLEIVDNIGRRGLCCSGFNLFSLCRHDCKNGEGVSCEGHLLGSAVIVAITLCICIDDFRCCSVRSLLIAVGICVRTVRLFSVIRIFLVAVILKMDGFHLCVIGKIDRVVEGDFYVDLVVGLDLIAVFILNMDIKKTERRNAHLLLRCAVRIIL